MNRTEFWNLIEEARVISNHDLETQKQSLRTRLQVLPLEDLLAFDQHLGTAFCQAHRSDLRSAVMFIGLPSGEGEFYELMDWLIAQGEATYTTVCATPELLPDVVRAAFPEEEDPEPYLEGLGSIAVEIYEQRCGDTSIPWRRPDVPKLWVADFLTGEPQLVLPELWQREAFPDLTDSHLTYHQWSSCDKLLPLLAFVRRRGRTPLLSSWFARRMRWFACACLRRVWNLLPDVSAQQAAGLAERFAAGQAPITELHRAYEALTAMCPGSPWEWPQRTREATLTAIFSLSWHYCDAIRAAPHSVAALIDGSPHPDQVKEEEGAFHCDALRDLFGDLFHPGVMQPEWFLAHDQAVRRLAEAIDKEADFERMPILGDALEEAGCDDAMILEHCRGGGVHVPGCWVLDLLLRGDQ